MSFNKILSSSLERNICCRRIPRTIKWDGRFIFNFFAITRTFVVNAYANAQILYYKHWKDYHVGLRFWWNLASFTRDTEPPPPPTSYSKKRPLPPPPSHHEFAQIFEVENVFILLSFFRWWEVWIKVKEMYNCGLT